MEWLSHYFLTTPRDLCFPNKETEAQGAEPCSRVTAAEQKPGIGSWVCLAQGGAPATVPLLSGSIQGAPGHVRPGSHRAAAISGSVFSPRQRLSLRPGSPDPFVWAPALHRGFVHNPIPTSTANWKQPRSASPWGPSSLGDTSNSDIIAGCGFCRGRGVFGQGDQGLLLPG